MSRDDRRVFILTVVLLLLIGLSLFYNTLGKDWLLHKWDYFKRRLYYERVIKKSNVPMHPARFWRQTP